MNEYSIEFEGENCEFDDVMFWKLHNKLLNKYSRYHGPGNHKVVINGKTITKTFYLSDKAFTNFKQSFSLLIKRFGPWGSI